MQNFTLLVFRKFPRGLKHGIPVNAAHFLNCNSSNKAKCTKLQDETDVNCAAKPSANYTLTLKND